MSLSLDLTDDIVTLTADERGMESVDALLPKLSRLARGIGHPFGVLLDLATMAPEDRPAFDSLAGVLLTELPSVGLRNIAVALGAGRGDFAALQAELAAAGVGAFMRVFPTRDQARQYLDEQRRTWRS